LNSDSKLDIAVTNYLSTTISVLLGTGTGSFNPKTDYANMGNTDDIVIADFNGDTKPDIATKGIGLPLVSVLLGSQSTGFTPPTTHQIGSDQFTALEIADFNGDGKTDLAVRGQQGITVLQNTGNSFAWQTPTNVNILFLDGGGTTTGDFNADGKPDLVTITDQNTLNVFLKK
jgi:hypothetical protein